MKTFFTLFFTFLCTIAFGQTTYQEWETQAESNIRLKPKYGSVQKTKEQVESDKRFIEETMKIEKFNGDKRLASNHMIELGFQYLYKGDLKTAMYRFNQAYLLDPKNTDIFWGFGAIYMSFSDYGKAKEQYEEGLTQNPENTHLLTDYGTYFLAKYYEAVNSKDNKANEYLDTAIQKLTMSYKINSKDENTLYKLSICYLMNSDCKNSRNFYDLCKDEGGKPITEEYTQELNKTCN